MEQPPGTGSKHSLDRIAGSVLRAKGVEFLFDLLQDNFVVDSVDPKLSVLYSMPWKRIYTTNYDNAAEVSRSGKFPISSVTIDEPQSTAGIGSVVHLNGYIKRVSPANLEKELLLTDASYAASRLVETGWLSSFERDLTTSRAVIFAGYSLYDLEIDKVLLAADSISRKTFFFIAPDADDIEVSTLQRYGTVVPGGIDVLVNKIEEVTSDYTPPSFIGGFTSLRELSTPHNLDRKGSSAEKLTEQFVYGQLPENEILARSPIFGNQTFLVNRRQDDEANLTIRQGTWRDILFVGEIASGKSASTLTLAVYLLDQSYKVFYAVRGASLSADLRKLSGIQDKVAVVFDGYASFRKEIVEYAGCRPITHRIIMAERSAIHELIDDFIGSTPQLGPVREVALDKIDAADAPAFEALVNFGGFWGERAGAGVITRQNYITKSLECSLYRLLVEIIKSEKVQAQLRELLQPVSFDIAIARAFCSVLIINSLGFRFSISEWQYLFDRRLIRRMLSTYADQVRHFLLSDTDHVYVRNGLLSSHVLHAFMDDGLVCDCLVDLYERAERRGSEGSEWRSLWIELTKFSSIEPMFSGPTKGENIFKYYDDIRVFGQTRNNPDYWLQVGIAATVLDDLPRGRLCFENAYSRERARPRPNLTRIDNYFSRFEMREAVAEPDSDLAFKKFITANERMEKQIFLDINRHYPFKTGRYFSDVAAKHYASWNDSQKVRFKEAVIGIKKKAEEWKSNRRESSADVEILIRETTSLLRRI